MINFEGRNVLITGAAGGLGREISWTFARSGANVYALDHDDEKGRRLIDLYPGDAAAERIHFVKADLADLKNLKSLVGELCERVGGIDVLINNAAVYPSKPMESYSIEEYQWVQHVNADAAMVCSLAVVPGMRAKNFGRIINVASTTLYGGWPLLMPYVVSKGALLGMTRAMARELGPHSITVNCVCPGAFPTDAEAIHPNPEGYRMFILEHQSLKRRGAPQDIAHVMTFFASEAAGFVTGQTLNVDGGWFMN